MDFAASTALARWDSAVEARSAKFALESLDVVGALVELLLEGGDADAEGVGLVVAGAVVTSGGGELALEF